MSSKTDLRAYFKRRATGSDGSAAKKKNPNPEIIASATEHVNTAKIEMVMNEVEKSTARQSYNNIPKHIRMEVGKYALAHSTKDALAKFSKQYPKYTFKRTSINSLKASFKNNGNSENLKKIGRPNLLSEEFLKRTKDVIIGSRRAGTVFSRRMVIAIGMQTYKSCFYNYIYFTAYQKVLLRSNGDWIGFLFYNFLHFRFVKRVWWRSRVIKRLDS